MAYSTYYNTDSKEIVRSSQSNLPDLKEQQGRVWDRGINRYLDEPIPEENRGYAFFEADWIPIVGATLQFDEAGAITGQIVPRLPQSEIERHLFAQTVADESGRIGSARRAAILARLARGTPDEYPAANESSHANHGAYHARFMLALVKATDNAGVNHNLREDSDLFYFSDFLATRFLSRIERTHAGHKARVVCYPDFDTLITSIEADRGTARYVFGVNRRVYNRTIRKYEFFADEPGAAESIVEAWAVEAAVGINIVAVSGQTTIAIDAGPGFGVPEIVNGISPDDRDHDELHACLKSLERGLSISAPIGATGATWIRIENNTAQIAVILDAGDNSVIARIAAADTADISPSQGANGLAVRLEAVEAPAEQPEPPADEPPPSE